MFFSLDEGDEGDEGVEGAAVGERFKSAEMSRRKKYLGKNFDVDTSFLFDREREEEENRLREELRREWEVKRERVKREEMEVIFSYWDGSGYRRTAWIYKGGTV